MDHVGLFKQRGGINVICLFMMIIILKNINVLFCHLLFYVIIYSSRCMMWENYFIHFHYLLAFYSSNLIFLYLGFEFFLFFPDSCSLNFCWIWFDFFIAWFYPKCLTQAVKIICLYYYIFSKPCNKSKWFIGFCLLVFFYFYPI